MAEGWANDTRDETVRGRAMADGVSEFDVANVLVVLEDGHRTRAELEATDQLTAALDAAITRGLVVADFRLTREGRERLGKFRELFAPREEDAEPMSYTELQGVTAPETEERADGLHHVPECAGHCGAPNCTAESPEHGRCAHCVACKD